MIGTIMKNGVLQDMVPYGCHSTVADEKFKRAYVEHSKNKPMQKFYWPDVMSKQCRYDKKASDERCKDCTHPYDSEYVESLK